MGLIYGEMWEISGIGRFERWGRGKRGKGGEMRYKILGGERYVINI